MLGNIIIIIIIINICCSNIIICAVCFTTMMDCSVQAMVSDVGHCASSLLFKCRCKGCSVNTVLLYTLYKYDAIDVV